MQKEAWEAGFAALVAEGGEVLAASSPFFATPTTGWQTPEIALIDSHKLLRSIILLLMGSDILSTQKAAVETSFLDYGESGEDSRALLKWTGYMRGLQFFLQRIHTVAE